MMNKSVNKSSTDLSGFFDKLKVKSSKVVVNSHLCIFKQLVKNFPDQQDDSSELTYVVNRLVRGLGSSDHQVQQSYFAGLAVLPEVFPPPILTVKHVFNAIKKELQLINNFSKREEGHVCMGQILAYGALIESGLLDQTGSAEEQQTVVNQLLELSKKRSYLPHVVDTFLDKLIASANDNLLSEIIWPEIHAEITKSKEQITLMLYHVASLCRQRLRSGVDGDIQTLFTSKHVINSNTIDDVTNQLMSVQPVSFLRHKMYADLCAWTAKCKRKTGVLATFWTNIETSYIMANCTPHKQAVVLKLFTLTVSQVKDISQILTMLSPNFKQLLLHIGKDKKPVLDTLVAAVIRIISVNTPVDTDNLIEIIKTLIFIDSKGIQPLINRLDEEGVLKLGEFLRSVITGTSTLDKKNGVNDPEKWSNREKICAVHALCRLIGHRGCEKNLDWRTEQLKFLVDLGFFIDSSVQGVGIELACIVREGLYSALNHRAQTLNDLRTILSRLVHHFDSHLKNDIKMRIKLTDEMLAAWKRLMAVIKSIEKKEAKDTAEKWQISIFHTMFLQIGLLLFQNVGFDKECLEELHSIYERTCKKKSSTAEEPQWTDVVIELFLSLLSRSNHLYRHAIGCVFIHLCPQLTAQNIHQILQVLDPKKESNPLIDEDTNEKDENTDSDEEKTNDGGTASGNEDGGDEDDDDDDDSDEDEEEEEDDEGTVTDKLRIAVREALGDAGTATDTESVDVDELDEEEGKRVDEALSLAFKSIRQVRAKRQTAKQKTLTHFRIRVIDLLDIWLNRTSPPLDLVLDVMITFLSLLEYSMTHDHEEPLESRTRVCLKKLTSIKKFSTTSEVTETQLADVFKMLLDKETKRATLFSGLSSVITDCCVFILKTSQHLTSETGMKVKESPVFGICQDALNDYFVKRDCLLPLALFESIFRLSWKGTWKLAPLLLDFLLNPDVRPFRQTQALYLLNTFFKNHRLIKDASGKRTNVLISISSQLHNVALKVLGEDGSCRLQPKFVKELLTLLRLIINTKWNTVTDMKETVGNLEKLMRKRPWQQNANLSSSSSSLTENDVSAAAAAAAAAPKEDDVNSSVKKRKTDSDEKSHPQDDSNEVSSPDQNLSAKKKKKKKSRKSLQEDDESNTSTKRVKLNGAEELFT